MLNGNEVIWLANLVIDKQNVLTSIIEKIDNGVFVIRSTEGLQSLRYEAVDEKILTNMNLKLIGIKHPNEGSSSSTFFYK
jgi:hypothetical protein